MSVDDADDSQAPVLDSNATVGTSPGISDRFDVWNEKVFNALSCRKMGKWLAGN